MEKTKKHEKSRQTESLKSDQFHSNGAKWEQIRIKIFKKYYKGVQESQRKHKLPNELQSEANKEI